MMDIKDHRRYVEGKLAESIKTAEAKVSDKELLAQVESTVANTGNEQLDKFIRNIQDSLDKHEEHAKDVAFKGIGCVQEDMIRLQQFEYFYTKGRVDMCKELMLVPERIIAESKPVLHSV